MKLIPHFIACVLIVLLALWKVGVFGEVKSDSLDYPTEAIKVVVPYPAGGGSDTFTRIVERAVVEDELLQVPLVIQNLGGGSGTIGSREVLEAAPDGYTLLMHHNALLGVYVDGVADFGPDDYEKIALTGSMTMAIIVREDAEFETLDDLLKLAAEKPKEVTFGANQGSQAYFTGKSLESSYPGAEFAFVNADGGADRYARLIGGHLDAGIFALSEYLDFVSPEGTPADQNIRALVVLSPKRHEAIPEVATSKEQGYPTFMENTYYWWAPKGTPQPILDKLASVLKQAMKNENVLAELGRLRVNPEYVDGDAMFARIDDTMAVMETAAGKTEGLESDDLPDIPLAVIVVTGLLLLGVVVQSLLGQVPEEDVVEELGGDFPKHPGIAAACFTIVLIYVALLQLGVLPWVILSTIMILLVGGLMAGWEKRRLFVIAELALLTSLGTAFLFTEVLTGVILP